MWAAVGATVVGDYHSYGDYSTAGFDGEAIRTNDPSKDEFSSDQFSFGPGVDTGGIDHGAAGNRNYPRGYVGTPGGKFLIYDPTTVKESPLQ